MVWMFSHLRCVAAILACQILAACTAMDCADFEVEKPVVASECPVIDGFYRNEGTASEENQVESGGRHWWLSGFFYSGIYRHDQIEALQIRSLPNGVVSARLLPDRDTGGLAKMRSTSCRDRKLFTEIRMCSRSEGALFKGETKMALHVDDQGRLVMEKIDIDLRRGGVVKRRHIYVFEKTLPDGQ